MVFFSVSGSRSRPGTEAETRRSEPTIEEVSSTHFLYPRSNFFFEDGLLGGVSVVRRAHIRRFEKKTKMERWKKPSEILPNVSSQEENF